MHCHVALVKRPQLAHEVREELLLVKGTLHGQLREELVDAHKLLVKVRVLEEVRETGPLARHRSLDLCAAVVLEFGEERRLHLRMHLEDVPAEHGKGKLLQLQPTGLHLVPLIDCPLVPVALRLLQEVSGQLGGRIEKLEAGQLPRPVVRDVDRGSAEVQVTDLGALHEERDGLEDAAQSQADLNGVVGFQAEAERFGVLRGQVVVTGLGPRRHEFQDVWVTQQHKVLEGEEVIERD